MVYYLAMMISNMPNQPIGSQDEPGKSADLNRPQVIQNLMVVSHYLVKQSRDLLSHNPLYPNLSLSFERPIQYLMEQPYSPGELAGKLNISKQACSKIVREMEGLGIIEKKANPSDARSSLLFFTETGLNLLQDGIEASNRIHQQFADALGQANLDQLTLVLANLCQALKAPVHEARTLSPEYLKKLPKHPAHLNALVQALSNFWQQSFFAELKQQGFSGLKTNFGQILGMIQHEPRHIQYIASVVGVSKQALAATANDLEASGYIVRQPDPTDKRQVLLELTELGQNLLNQAVKSVQRAEQHAADLLTPEQWQSLQTHLHSLYLQVASHYDSANVLGQKIQQLANELINDLGTTGANALAQHLLQLTRGK